MCVCVCSDSESYHERWRWSGNTLRPGGLSVIGPNNGLTGDDDGGERSGLALCKSDNPKWWRSRKRMASNDGIARIGLGKKRRESGHLGRADCDWHWTADAATCDPGELIVRIWKVMRRMMEWVRPLLSKRPAVNEHESDERERQRGRRRTLTTRISKGAITMNHVGHIWSSFGDLVWPKW